MGFGAIAAAFTRRRVVERLGRNAVAVTMAGYGVAGVAVGLAPSVIAAAPVLVPGRGLPGVDSGHPQLDGTTSQPALGAGSDHEPVVPGLRRCFTARGDPGRCGSGRPHDHEPHMSCCRPWESDSGWPPPVPESPP